MAKKISFVLAGGILIVLIIMAVAYFLGKNAKNENGENVTSELSSVAAKSSQETVQDFYNFWLGPKGNGTLDKINNSSDWLSENAKKKLRDTFNSTMGNADPVICAQDLPESHSIKTISEKNGKAEVVAELNFYGTLKETRFSLLKTNDNWLIDDISCARNNATPQGLELSGELQNLVGDYLRENISALSPEKEVLGGKFYLTKVEFESNDSAVVSYEDGHIAMKARVKFSLVGGKVKILGVEKLPVE